MALVVAVLVLVEFVAVHALRSRYRCRRVGATDDPFAGRCTLSAVGVAVMAGTSGRMGGHWSKVVPQTHLPWSKVVEHENANLRLREPQTVRRRKPQWL